MEHEFRSAEERRAAIVALTQKETGIDETMIETLIRAFYARVRQDALLAPIFESRISEWEPHLDNMFAFWSSLTLQTGRYHGQPMAKHMPLAVDARHFDRWLALFEETARDLCPPAAAERFIERARRVAESLELGVASANGVLLGKGRITCRRTASAGLCPCRRSRTQASAASLFLSARHRRRR
jgi:hemoglobin